MYFSRFPITRFQVSPPSYKKAAQYVNLVDITRNVRFKKEVIDNIVLYDYYVMREHETVEIVSEYLYGSPYYHWVLMLLNDRYDYRKDFAMPNDVFTQYIIAKYGSEASAKQLIVDLISDRGTSTTVAVGSKKPILSFDPALNTNVVKLLDESTGAITPATAADFQNLDYVRPVFAYDYELESNESKRRIKVVSQQLLNTILRNFKDLM
ncbi:MAG: baseplate wedge protein 53 [Desulfuromonadaceae bacterium]